MNVDLLNHCADSMLPEMELCMQTEPTAYFRGPTQRQFGSGKMQQRNSKPRKLTKAVKARAHAGEGRS